MTTLRLGQQFFENTSIRLHKCFTVLSSYEWRCSPLDTINNKYYLPDFGGTASVLGYTWALSVVGVTYIYDVDESTLNCSGTVTAVEFCYFRTSSSRNHRNVFDLLILTRQDSNSIRVTKSIPISFHPSSDQCDSADSSQCCDIMTLTEQDQFDIAASNFLIGMVNVETPNLAAFFANMYPRFQTPSYQLSVGRPTANSMLTLSGAISQPLRLMWFHISKQLKIIHFNTIHPILYYI